MNAIALISGGIVLCLICGCASGPERGLPLTYQDEVVLQNAQVRLAVSPQVGRIVSFGRVGGSDLLWRNTPEAVAAVEPTGWKNFGGDKVWPSQQGGWEIVLRRAWPPDEVIDGRAWSLAERGENRVAIESPVSPYLNIRVRREIELAKDEPLVTIRNTITRTAPSPFSVQIWSVTQVQPPAYLLLDVAEDRPEPAAAYRPLQNFSLPYETLVQVLDGTLLYPRTVPPEGHKVGTFGRWLAAVYDRDIFLQQTEFDASACYPDGSNLQVYQAKDYVELETLSPQVHLLNGQTLRNTVTWRLLTAPRESTPQKTLETIRRGI